ncbi:MAG: ISAs1 family transposase [Phycisphaerales bacterium]|nr:ISAs1 family transposase [Phycisphaerales bacterium]
MAGSIMVFFSGLPDPRGDRGSRHLLADIITIAILSVLCGGEDFTDMEDFGHGREEWLRTFLKLPAGIPSHDTFGRVFAAIDPEAFEACFRAWTGAVAGELAGVVAIDGKTIRRSFDRAGRKAAVHMVSAWGADNGVVFGQVAADAKSNEITAIPKLLRMLELKGLIVTIDAMGCQREIAAQIEEQKGEYVLSVKANQPALLADIKEAFRWARQRGFRGLKHAESTQTDKGHGRIEVRHITVLWELALLRDRAAWAGLKCIAEMRCERTTVGGTTSIEHRWFISSVLTRRSEELGRACRAHWGVENGLHWCLDVAFGEDQSRARAGYAAENLSRTRRLALNMLKLFSDPRKRSIKRKRFMAGLDENYLWKVLGSRPTAPDQSQPPRTSA